MSSPPFNPSETTPADASLVSAYPAAERTYRDIMESWMIFEHGRSGHHTFYVIDTTTRDADTTWEVGSLIYNTTATELQVCVDDSPITWVGGGVFTDANTALEIFDAIKQAATTTYSGVVELATDAETVTGTDTARAVTPSNITGKQATEAEAKAGTSTTKLMTPLAFSQALPARGYAEYTTNTNLTGSIPFDDTKPQVSEGDQILTCDITTKRDDSRVRATFNCQAASANDAAHIIAAIFYEGSSDALNVTVHRADSDGGAMNYYNITCVVEHAPGNADTYTYQVRMCCPGGTYALNGNTSGRTFGGSSRATLVLQEIYV